MIIRRDKCYFKEVVLLVMCCEKSLQTSFAKELIIPFGPKLSNYLKSAALLDVSSSENLSVMKPLNGRDPTKNQWSLDNCMIALLLVRKF